jgi:hypothetical protein
MPYTEADVDGVEQETTMMRRHHTFPYVLKITGADGVTDGSVYLYELTADGTTHRGHLACNFSQRTESYMKGKIRKVLPDSTTLRSRIRYLCCKAKGIFRQQKI